MLERLQITIEARAVYREVPYTYTLKFMLSL